MNEGITRIQIVSDWNDWRTELARKGAPVANTKYRQMFEKAGCPLAPGEATITCTKEEAIARYDYQEGIDLILRHIDSTKATMQEKFLSTQFNTATFEEVKSFGDQGAWYTCTAQYYSVLYTTDPQPVVEARILDSGYTVGFRMGVILDLPALHRLTLQDKVAWEFNGNARDGRKATFRYMHFVKVPDEALIASFGVVRKPQTGPTPLELRANLKAMLATMKLSEIGDVIGEVIAESVASKSKVA